jgi:hypothetical protein
VYRVGGDTWMSTGKSAAPGTSPTLRYGASAQGRAGSLVRQPGIKSEWIEVTPATPGNPAMIGEVAPPSLAEFRDIQVTTMDGHSTTLHWDGERSIAPHDDANLGPSGPVEAAALLRDFPRVAEVMRDSAETSDVWLHGVALGRDGVALVSGHSVNLIGPFHPWFAKVSDAFGSPPARAPPPRFQIRDGEIFHEDVISDTVPSKLVEENQDLGDVQRRGDAIMAVHKGLYDQAPPERGGLLTDRLPRETRVIVREVRVADLPNSGTLTGTAVPDVLYYRRAEWRTIEAGWFAGAAGGGNSGGAAGGRNGGGVPTPTTTTTPPSSSVTAPPTSASRDADGPPGTVILFVCPADGDDLVGCAS